MQAFIVLNCLLVSNCWAQLRDPFEIDESENRTPRCEPPSEAGRERRQAPAAQPFAWFTTNGTQCSQLYHSNHATVSRFNTFTGETITKEECFQRNQTAAEAGNRIDVRGPVLVQRGVVSKSHDKRRIRAEISIDGLFQYDVCVKFDDAPTWFFTKGGTNAACDPSRRCCEWFPPYHNPCSAIGEILWWETKNTCEEAFSEIEAKGTDRASLHGVDYIYGASVGEKRTLCHVINPKEFLGGEEPKIRALNVEITYCGEKCCVYREI